MQECDFHRAFEMPIRFPKAQKIAYIWEVKCLHIISFFGLLILVASCRKVEKKDATQFYLSTDSELIDMEFIEGEDFVMVGGINFQSGAVIRYYDTEDSLIQEDDRTDFKLLYDIDFFQNTLYACGQDGKILHSRDSGASWNIFTNQTWTEFVEMEYYHPDSGWAVGPKGNFGMIVHLNSYGDYYKFHQFSQQMYSLFLDASKNLVVGGSGIIVYSQDYGKTFTASDADGDIFIKILEYDNILYAFGLWGSVLMSADMGVHWDRLQNAKYRASGTVIRDAALFSDGRMIRVGDEGTMHFSEDGWSTYSDIEIGFTDYNFLGISLKNEEEVWLMGNNGLILNNIEIDG